MADEDRVTYYITAKEMPVSIAIEDVTYEEALNIATHCSRSGEVLHGPTGGPEGYVVNFDLVPGLRITPRQPAGAAMLMAPEVVALFLKEIEEDESAEPRGGGDDDLVDDLIAFLQARRRP
ncbi:hypothetical protein [Amycolatopsis sp. NPDC001319]|uniref:hypothetical protein n=1 Tax=unclassified Amycolatopsis TaxID=2618356 RepID=UPI0036CE6BD5